MPEAGGDAAVYSVTVEYCRCYFNGSDRSGVE